MIIKGIFGIQLLVLKLFAPRRVIVAGVNSTQIPTVLLAGGFGTRLRSVVQDEPKVLAPVKNRPFLEHLILDLYTQGARWLVLSLHHQADRIISFCESSRSRFPADLKIEWSVEPEPLGTGGAIQYIHHSVTSLKNRPHLAVWNADTFLTQGYSTLEKEFSKRPFEALVGVVQVPDISRYGRVSMDEDGVIVGFEEKQPEKHPGWIYAGVSCVSMEALQRVGKQAFSLEKDFFPGAVDRKQAFAFKVDSYFIDIGIPEDYARFGER